MADVQYRVLDNTVKKLKDMGDGTHAEVVHVGGPITATVEGPIEATVSDPIAVTLSPALITDAGGASQRLRVDPGQTGFFAGRMFRMFYEFSIAQGASHVIRFVSTKNFILWKQDAEVDAGGVKVENITAATPGGAWTGVTVVSRNRMTEVPLPIPTTGMTVIHGGTITGETVVDVLRVRSAANQGNSRSSTVGEGQSDERGLPPGTYFIRISALPGVTETSTGVLHMSWEERA